MRADRTGYDLDSVVVDNVAGARRSVELLQQAGFHDIACISGPEHVETAAQRTAGWREAVVATTGATPDAAYDVRTSYSVGGGEPAMRELLRLPRPPDAVFAANNTLAVGLLRTLLAQGLTPPSYGVLAFGDLPLLTYTPLGVMVVHLPSREIGEVAAGRPLERIEGFVGMASGSDRRLRQAGASHRDAQHRDRRPVRRWTCSCLATKRWDEPGVGARESPGGRFTRLSGRTGCSHGGSAMRTDHSPG